MSANATTTPTPDRRRKAPLVVASGSFRWLSPPDPVTLEGVLVLTAERITTRPARDTYHVSPIRDDEGYVVGWSMAKTDGTDYALWVSPDPELPWTCECGDYVYHRDRAETLELRECKHVRGLKAALGSAGVKA